MQQTFIIGWDGATWDLIKPWVAEGKLPNIAKLINGGVHGPLRSTLPPMTFPAWSSFMTGVNPGKHGIYDFTRQRPGTYEIEFVNGGQRKAPSFWRLLSDAGKKVISVSVPCTFPPEKVNGVMISGFDAPGLGGEGATVDARGMHPPELYSELQTQVGGHPIGAFIVNDINKGQPEKGVERMVDSVRRKAQTVKYLMQSHPWDCCMILFGESDGCGHHFWKHCDPNSPLFQEEPSHLRDSIFRVYEELDKQTGELLELLPPDANLLMMSDHGFGGVSNWVLYPNCWLRERGFLDLRGGAWRRWSRMVDAVKLMAVSRLPAKVKRGIYRLSRRRVGAIEASVRYSMINWSNTQAYFEENPYYPGLWINLAGRQPAGIVQPGDEYNQLRDRLIEDLENWVHPESGKPIVEKAFRREDVYSGVALSEAPDIVVKWAEHEGYTYAFKLSSKSKDLKWAEAVDPHTKQNLAFFTGKSGSHRDDGIFLAHGPAVKPGGETNKANITDIAPTILHMQGVPVPQEMDGRVLEEIFTDEYVASHQTEFTQASASTEPANVQDDYSNQDEETISERLRSLGYIE